MRFWVANGFANKNSRFTKFNSQISTTLFIIKAGWYWKVKIKTNLELVWVDLGLLQSLIVKPKRFQEFGNSCDIGGITWPFQSYPSTKAVK